MPRYYTTGSDGRQVPTIDGLALLLDLPADVVAAAITDRTERSEDGWFKLPRPWVRRSRRTTARVRAALGYRAGLVDVLDWLAHEQAENNRAEQS